MCPRKSLDRMRLVPRKIRHAGDRPGHYVRSKPAAGRRRRAGSRGHPEDAPREGGTGKTWDKSQVE